MRAARLTILGLLPALIAGCAIHPLPENVTGVSTYDIVRQIRCETRQAVIQSTLDYLTKGTDVDAASREIGLRFANNEIPISKLDPKMFKGHVGQLLNLFWSTGVAYNYKLEMTETNNLGVGLDLLKPFANSRITLGLGAGFDRQRQNTRTFTVTDNFRNLVQKLSDEYCSRQLVAENYVYPITGRVGVEGMVHAFVYLSLFGNLAGKEDNPAGPPTLVDALDFQTTISGSASPKVTFTPLGRGLSLTEASLISEASRKDVHRVVIGLALDKAANSQVGPTRDALFGRLLTASGNRAELAAANAVDQFLTQTVFSPTIVVQP
jgi:hypothetical protein